MSQTQNLEEPTPLECSVGECRRVADLWFPDATLILRAENTLFRVYPNILSARSTVFGDMISVPQPAEPEGHTLDGHAIVYLHDSASEVEVFLRAVFDSSYFMPPPAPTDHATVIGIMRLAHKYDVPYLFQRALHHLGNVYPTTLAEFINTMVTKTTPSHVDIKWGDVTVDLITIRATSEVGAVWLFPTAYYSTCTFSAEKLVSAGKSWDALSSNKQQTCLMLQGHLVRATTRAHRFLRHIPSLHCSSNETCQEAVSAAHGNLEWRIDQQYDMHPVTPNFFHRTSAKLCDTCRELATEMFTETQESFWGKLPSILGLPTWEELNKRRAEVLGLEG
ncbi:hypothetical protein FB451DRAFT_1208374 [Mycena latifolia]|nr:hypothetical protein FB451DRAFT_1208374 [Mycena latifolia]